MKLWTTFAVMISTTLLADQPPTNTAPATLVPTPPPVMQSGDATAAGVPQPKPMRKKSAGPKPAAKSRVVTEVRTVPLVAGPAVVTVGRGPVNIRGRAGLIGEVIGKATNGEPITVIEEVTLKKSKADEPSAWAKIQLPPDVNVWVKASFVDATNKTVLAKKLNVRGGPGENYSIVGSMSHGDAIQEVETKGEWMKIQPPAGAYAFMAAQYLKQGPALATTEPLTPPTAATVPETAPIAQPPAEPPATPEPPMATTPPPAVPETTPAPVVEEPPPPRIVQREGLVRGAFSIQAPTRYELISPDNGKAIDYLFTTSTNLDLSRYKGLHIIVTGEESLDERWKNTPVITIQKIVVLE